MHNSTPNLSICSPNLQIHLHVKTKVYLHQVHYTYEASTSGCSIPLLNTTSQHFTTLLGESSTVVVSSE